MVIRVSILACAAVLATTAATVQAQVQHDFRSGSQRIAEGKDPIPGPRDCFWMRGPASADPYINIAYPDAATFYWAAVFTTPPGAKLEIEGKFPHARYISYISYDQAGAPNDSIADYLIKPLPGSTNPFLPGADRTAKERSYKITVADRKPDPGRKTGMNLVGVTRDTLDTPKYGGGQQTILYRIYVNDAGMDETGGAGLPQAVLTMSDGKVLRGAEACMALRTRQPLLLTPEAMAVPMDKYYELLEAAKKISPLHPASNPPTWYQQLDREALYDIYRGKPLDPNAPKSTGGFYPNLDNQYIRTILNRRFGHVFVMRGKAPTTPRTLKGDAKFGSGDLRYWSFCSNQGFANTRVNACVHDEIVPVGPDGYYTIVVSRAADRPRNARPECGIAWLPMADDGDGAVDDNVTVLQLRHMLGEAEFVHSVQGVGKPGNEEKAMAEYFPRGRYMQVNAFETAVPCIVQRR